MSSRRWAEPYLPALVRCAVVGVVLCDVIVDSVECELLVRRQRDGLDDQLCIGVGRLGVVLEEPSQDQESVRSLQRHPSLPEPTRWTDSPWDCRPPRRPSRFPAASCR